MDYDRVAFILASCTSRGLRWSLSASPHDTLRKCGFDLNEIAQLTRSLGKGKGRKPGGSDLTRLSYVFQSIDQTFGKSKKSDVDNWLAP